MLLYLLIPRISHLSSLMAVRESYPSIYDFKNLGRPSDASAVDGAVDAEAAVIAADKQLPLIFNEDNIRATFSMMEPTGKKTTTRRKYHHALQVIDFPFVDLAS